MQTSIPFGLSAVLALGTLVIGSCYIAAPEKISGSFGLKPPATDADTRAWLRLKGIRDIASGLAVLTLMWTTNYRTTGILLLVFASIAFGDMANILVSGGSTRVALSVHGLTCAVMIVTALLLLHAA